MINALLHPDHAYDRRAIMADAPRQRRLMASHGWSWGRCLSFAWAKAKAQKTAEFKLETKREIGAIASHRLNRQQ